MKSILMSIQPKWCELIASGKKTIEVRKTAPKEVPFKVYIYMTKSPQKLIGVLHKGDDIYGTEYVEDTPTFITIDKQSLIATRLYGKTQTVIGEFVCDKVEEINIPSIFLDRECEQSCMTVHEMLDYLESPNTKRYDNKPLYGLHISQLKIYDKPKELGEFKRKCNGECVVNKKQIKCPKIIEIATRGVFRCDNLLPITRPPQSWMYVESLDD